MKTKNLLLALILGAAALFVGCTASIDGASSSKTHVGLFDITQEAVSTTSITISWPVVNGDRSYSTIHVYNDINLTDLAQEYKFEGVDNTAHKFTVPFLNCKDNFYIVVTNSKGEKSHICEVSLEDSIARQVIFSQNFDKLCWGYDYVNSACGIRLNSDKYNNLDRYEVDNLADSAEDCHIVTSAGEEGGSLFKCSDKLKQLFGLVGWSGTGSIYMRPGYVKLGKATASGTLKSPNFSSINDGEKVTGTLTFRACIYATGNGSENGSATVSIVKKDGKTTLWKENISLNRTSNSIEWKYFEFEVENLTNEYHFEISSNDQTRQICFDNLKLTRKINIPKGHIYGYIIDKDTNEPIKGVAVSDGFQVVVTNKDGFYSMEPNKDTYYVFYSLPAEYRITIGGNGLPKFFTRYESGVKEYNFSLRKLEGGAEKKFALFALADPQVTSDTKINRFKNEAITEIKKHVKSLDCQCYGITLGDIISNSSGSNTELFRPKMREAMHYNKTGLPIYQVMGNHDANYYDEINRLEGNDKNERNIKAQRAFESINGPINYSFNRGNVHVIGMKDIVYNDATSMANYTGGFIDSQYEWLKQDLAVVPKDMTVVLCVHIPLHNYRVIGSVNHMGDVHQLLNQFKEAHILSGHTHYNLNKEPSSSLPNIYEHNVGTVCGTWWTSNLCGDGTPNGYGVFISDSSKGSGFTEWYYMGYNKGMNTRDYQLRLYRGNAITGAKKDDNKNGTEGYYQFSYDDDVILANVFNADSKWTIEVYEDGVKTGTMKKLSNYKPSFSSITGKGTWESPYKTKNTSSKKSSLDMWVVGFHMGVLDRFSKDNNDEDAEGDEELLPGGTPSNGSWTANDHMYSYTLKNKNAKIKVVAIDRFGNKYETDKFVDYRDNDLARKP